MERPFLPSFPSDPHSNFVLMAYESGRNSAGIIAMGQQRDLSYDHIRSGIVSVSKDLWRNLRHDLEPDSES